MSYIHLLKLYLIFYLFSLVSACGITTHTVIAQRAAHLYDQTLDSQTKISSLFTNHIAAFQAGNPYPDLFYGSQCLKGTKSDVSEDTHWVPFLNATLNYIRRKYTQPYNEDALNLIAFTLGFVSHQMADVTWHSLGISQGFLSAMGFVNFHGIFDAAHSVGDVGGDIVNQFELDLKYISDLGNWYVPAEDLYNVYLEFYGEERVTKNDIVECSSILFLGRLGEQLAISYLYQDYANKSTFMDEQLNDYFLGGLHDMATWTQISWDKVLFMLKNGTEKCRLPSGSRSILDIDCKDPRETQNLKQTYKYFSNRDIHKFGKSILEDDKSFLSIKQVSKGVNLSPSEKFKQVLNYHKKLVSKQATSTVSTTTLPIASYSLNNEYSSLGFSLSSGDINNDRTDDILIGSPVYSDPNAYQTGAAFLVLSVNKSSVPLVTKNLDENTSLVFRPPYSTDSRRSRFGHATIILDINQDGYEDIIISAPSYGLESLEYQGRVFIYFGGSGHFANVSIEITCTSFKYCNLGWSLSKGDVNGDGFDDLVVSSPFAGTCAEQCGFLGVLFSSKNQIERVIDAADLDYVLTGNMGYEWFGHSSIVKFGYLAVGAPESRLCQDCSNYSPDDVQAVGRVYLFKYPTKTPVKVLNGTDEFEQFGYSFDLAMNNEGNVVLAVSSVTKAVKLDNAKFASLLKNAGMVQIFNLTNETVDVIATLKSDRSFSNFGSAVRFFGGDLYVSGQKRSEDVYLKVPQGRVYRFKNGAGLRGNVTDECSWLDESPCPGEKAARVYGNGENKSRFGSDLIVLKSQNRASDVLVVSSIFSENQNQLMTGRVNIFKLDN